MEVSILEQRLVLRHTFKLARSSSDERVSFVVRLKDLSGRIGLGEATPLHYLGETPATLRATLERWSFAVAARASEWEAELDRVAKASTTEDRGRLPATPLVRLGEALARIGPDDPPARCAFDVAFHDLFGQRTGSSVASQLGVDPSQAPGTAYTVAIAEIAQMRERAASAIAAGHRTLKLKVGASDGPRAADIVAAIREVHAGPLLVDANGGWTEAEAAAEIASLERYCPTFVEQPLLRGTPEALGRLAARTSIPIFADEDVLDSRDLERLPDNLGGINVKLMKAGGLTEATALVRAARARGWKVMLGCMIESSVGITAAAHLAGTVDFADLDGAMLLVNDPARGAVISGHGIGLPTGPGLGASLIL